MNKFIKNRAFFRLDQSLNETADNAFKITQIIAISTGKTLENLIENGFIRTRKIIEQGTESTGRALQNIAENPLVQAIKKLFGADWLMSILGEVNIEKVQAKVKQFQKEYPEETSKEIARRLILAKAWEAGRVGFVTNIIPPIAAALLGIELIAIIKLQAEMIYEIAAAYGLNLREPTRRGEVLAIFGLSFSGNVIKGGLNLMEIIPGAGPIIGASSNALLLYVLGFTACRFYEGKIPSTVNIKAWKQETEEYWHAAYEQAKIMDRVLVHMILASYPDKSWADILPVLKQISPSSVETVATDIENPQPLDKLLERLSPNFAVLLLSRCYSIAQLDSVITSQEQKILDAVQKHLQQNYSLNGV